MAKLKIDCPKGRAGSTAAVGAKTQNQMPQHSLLQQLGRRQTSDAQVIVEFPSPLINDEDLEEFLNQTAVSFDSELDDILERAIGFTLQSHHQSLEVSFISSSAALESVLTFFRRQSDYEILAPEEFSELERDLKKWLKQQPALASEPEKRALIYEKVPELNRFPFSSVFKKFCEHYSLDLTDLWPVIGKHADWPLTEIRHRLVHGDPFIKRPPEALACAGVHLSWVVERMLLCVLGWPVERSSVRAEYLNRTRPEHQNWQIEQSKFA